MKKILLCAGLGALALIGSGGSAHAQNNRWCATDEHNAALQQTFHDPVLARERAAADALAERLQNDEVFAQQFRAEHWGQRPQVAGRPAVASRVVPVVVHVITRCGQRTLTEAQVQLGIDKMNADWALTNADFPTTYPPFIPYAANCDVEFRLARLDPQGNPFGGIHRVSAEETNATPTRNDIKTIVPSWNGYFNFWLVDAISAGPGSPPGGTILGYAQFPGFGPWSTWGMVMRYDDWLTPPPISDGRTATHELGHCFNLFHTFQGGCGTTCTNSGDEVCDTPPEAAPTYDCNKTRSTCANDVGPGSPYTTNVADQIQNHMSYNSCHTLFTIGQKARIDAAFTQFPYIQNLISPANLLRTGVSTGQVVGTPVPVGYLNVCQLGTIGKTLTVCAGRPVTFTDASYGGPIAGVSWTFTGATPATSTATNPTVTFTTPGRQIVTLTPADASGAGVPLTTIVEVLPAGPVAPLTESFEGGRQLADSVWHVTSTAPATSRRWRLIGMPGLTTDGDTALILRNGDIGANIKNNLYSPPFDTRAIASSGPLPTLKFDIAYARRSASSADELRVYLSNDCARTWVLRKTLIGAALATTTVLQLSWVPSALTQWRTEMVNLPSSYINQEAMMVRFEATSQGNGNNLYLDNVRINGRLLGLTADLAAAGVALAPNPLTTETGLTFALDHATQVAVRVSDLLGRSVLTEAARTFVPGNHELPLAARLRGAAPGVYVVTVELDGRAYTQKLLVQ